MLLPSPKELKDQLPLSPEQYSFVQSCRELASRIIQRKEKKIVVIAGPCSIHDLDTARDYAKRFKELAMEAEKNCFLVMRVYMEKPRTTVGWKGLLYDPFLDGSNDIRTGLYWTRQFFLELAEMKIAIATEFVDPLAASYFDDLITWGFIGARTCASQTHRQLASSLSMPIGFKNSPDGNLENAIHGVIAARAPHVFMYVNEEGQLISKRSMGNPLTHIVLRGSTQTTNYDPHSIHYALEKLQCADLEPLLMVDCSHGNCQRKYEKQKDVFYSVLDQIELGNRNIIGMMLESHLEAGNAVSITDPCIDWSTTEELIASVGSFS